MSLELGGALAVAPCKCVSRLRLVKATLSVAEPAATARADLQT